MLSNHPNTLIDPVVVASLIRRPIFFLANAGLFRKPIWAAFFRYIFCIPVTRSEDIAGGGTPDNRQAFEASGNHLASGGNIYVAVEGTSWMERVLRPFKTGFARIGLSALEGPARGGEIYVLPVAINYAYYDRSGGDLQVEVAPPIPLSPYLESYRQDPSGCIRRLTEDVRNDLVGRVIHARDTEEEVRLKYSLALVPVPGENQDQPFYQVYRQYLKQLRAWEARDDISMHSWERKVHDLSDQLIPFQFTLESLSGVMRKGVPSLWEMLLISAGLPVYVYTWCHYGPAVWGSRWLQKRLNFYPGYTSTVKILGAIVLGPISWIVLFSLVREQAGALVAWINLLMLPWSGWYFFSYERRVKEIARYGRWQWIKSEKRKMFEDSFRELAATGEREFG